jgi:hypothetical protein
MSIELDSTRLCTDQFIRAELSDKTAPNAPAGAPPAPSEHRMKVVRWVAIVCVVLLLLYGASPYFSFWRLTVAIRSGDSAAISSRMDFPALRASLKKQLIARFVHATSGQKRWANLGPTLIDAIVDAYATPDGIAALISNPGALKNLQNPRQFRFSTGKPEGWSKLKYAFFTGPRFFVVDREDIKLRFRFTGLSWQLNDLDLGLAGQNAKPR